MGVRERLWRQDVERRVVRMMIARWNRYSLVGHDVYFFKNFFSIFGWLIETKFPP